MTIEAKSITDKSEWEGFIQKHPEANFLQSWYWGEFHKKLGKQIERIGLYQGSDLIGVLSAVVEPARRGRYLTVSGGPILDWENNELIKTFDLSVKEIAVKHSCVFIRIRPQLIDNETSRAVFKSMGARPAPMHLTADLTSQIDLFPTEDELMSHIRKSTRYEIRQAQKLGIKITASTDPDEIDQFYAMQLKTAKRHGFVPFSLAFLKEQFATFAAENLAVLYKAEYEGKILAEAFIIFYGSEATYHYGASTVDGRKYPGAYLIQWEAIREAKRRGMSRYNLWGVAPKDQKDHRFYGVSIFKRGFGGAEIQYLRAQDIVINRIKYSVNFAVESARKRLRKV
jgi:peptidoglycan pentaglycine glycine transferase (the first glycine)